MEGTDKYTVRILRELAARWKPWSIPGAMLKQIADALEHYFEKFPGWEDGIAEYEEGPDAEEQG